jgi:hypothetical protein
LRHGAHRCNEQREAEHRRETNSGDDRHGSSQRVLARAESDTGARR